MGTAVAVALCGRSTVPQKETPPLRLQSEGEVLLRSPSDAVPEDVDAKGAEWCRELRELLAEWPVGNRVLEDKLVAKLGYKQYCHVHVS